MLWSNLSKAFRQVPGNEIQECIEKVNAPNLGVERNLF
jgi:hypothetical protein